MTTTQTTNADAVARFVGAARGRNFPADVVDTAKKALVDSLCVAVGAYDDAPAVKVRQVVENWHSTGDARIIFGGTTTPSAAAFVNATMGHCMDYDDTHVGSVGHLSNPAWAAVLAVGRQLGASERDMLAAFITGFETAARLGGKGVGQQTNKRGWHSTGVFGCFGVATAASVLHGLDEEGVRNALGVAATQVGGLIASFGTMSKPFHAGKAAFNGILAAELAAEDFVAAKDLIEPDGALNRALIQDGTVLIESFRMEEDWELLQNTFKPYSACLLTHPTIDNARKLAPQVKGKQIAEVTAYVNPLTLLMAAKPAPTTGLEGKFSAAYCASLGLSGRNATFTDYLDEKMGDQEVMSIVPKVKLVSDDSQAVTSGRMVVRLADGSELTAETPLALGNPGNPMTWDNMAEKFFPLVEPRLGAGKAKELYDVLRNFERSGSAKALDDLLRA
ncbi:MAG: MmgE/PrpD family protein [Alphaproteobacteria bacterium]